MLANINTGWDAVTPWLHWLLLPPAAVSPYSHFLASSSSSASPAYFRPTSTFLSLVLSNDQTCKRLVKHHFHVWLTVQTPQSLVLCFTPSWPRLMSANCNLISLNTYRHNGEQHSQQPSNNMRMSHSHRQIGFHRVSIGK